MFCVGEHQNSRRSSSNLFATCENGDRFLFWVFWGFVLKQGLNIDLFICWLVTSSENTDTVDGRNPAPLVTWDEKNCVNNRIIYLSTGAVFLLSRIFTVTVFLECIKLEWFSKWYMQDTALVANEGVTIHIIHIYIYTYVFDICMYTCATYTTNNMIYIVFMIFNRINCILDQFNNIINYLLSTNTKYTSNYPKPVTFVTRIALL